MFVRFQSYGTLPSAKALKDACAETGGDEKGGCPICQEEFKEPIELSCKVIKLTGEDLQRNLKIKIILLHLAPPHELENYSIGTS